MRLPLADPAGALGITARRQITFSSLFGVVAAPFNLLARFGEPYQHRVAAVPCLPCRGEDAKVTSRRSRPMKAATGDQFFGGSFAFSHGIIFRSLRPTTSTG